MLGKDLIMQTLLGGGSSGGGSSGGGGGSAAVNPKEVNFYDYDGTCVHAYTVEEAQALSELPAGPEHPGLVFQGWNWSLEGVNALTRAMNIGAMYTTDDGTTRLYITLQEGRTSPMLGVGVNGTVTVDWGDGTEPDVLKGTSTSTTKWTPNHAYAAPGDYVIRLTVEGEISFTGTTSGGHGASILRKTSVMDNTNRTYQMALKRVEIGGNIASFGTNAFDFCSAIETITMPNNVKSIGTRPFSYCSSLAYITIPNGVETIGGMSDCTCVRTIATPSNATDISSSGYYNCFDIVRIAIPSNVKNIAANAFNGCCGMRCYDFTACTVVPTLSSSNVFNKIPADCEIRVPTALYDEWIAATNWATYASQIVAY